MAKHKNTETLPDPQRAQLNRLMDGYGIEWTRKRLVISRHALERAAGGLTVQRGTVAYLTLKLAERFTQQEEGEKANV